MARPDRNQSSLESRLLAVGYAAVVAIFLSVVWYACTGPRGSDQFWYLGDILTLLEHRPAVTNTVYPGPLIRGLTTVKDFAFIHNTLILYAVLPLARVLGAYAGWILLDTVLALGVATTLAVVLNQVASKGTALVGFALFLLTPLTIWQTCNVLQEMGYCAATTLVAVLYVYSDRGLGWWIAIFATVCIGVLVHPLFIPLACALPVAFLWQRRRRIRVADVGLAVACVAIGLLLARMNAVWFPTMRPPHLRDIFVGTVPGVGNMEWQLRANPPPVTIGLLISKVRDALARQFNLSEQAIFVWPANVMALCSLLLFRHRRADDRIARLTAATAVLLALIAFMVCCHTNQFRSTQIVTPVIVLGFTVYAHRTLLPRFGRRWLVTAAIVAVGGFVAADLIIAQRIHVEGIEARSDIAAIRAQTKALDENAHVVIEVATSGEPQMLAYALRPRPCLILKEGYLSKKRTRDLLASFRPKLIFCRPESELPDLAHASPRPGAWPGRYHELRAYTVDRGYE